MSDEHYPGEADCAMTDHAQLDTVEQLRVRVAELETELEEYRHLAETVGASKAIAERNTAWTRVAELEKSVHMVYPIIGGEWAGPIIGPEETTR